MKLDGLDEWASLTKRASFLCCLDQKLKSFSSLKTDQTIAQLSDPLQVAQCQPRFLGLLLVRCRVILLQRTNVGSKFGTTAKRRNLFFSRCSCWFEYFSCLGSLQIMSHRIERESSISAFKFFQPNFSNFCLLLRRLKLTVIRWNTHKSLPANCRAR